ncbi:hypothetical protein HYH03_012131 [Edaphochlamys debaryana]|uniref:Uncharacterized protein n=1 Tax=Edaphochlamys debaryana TaxID=47281 RepID=A0A835XT70_9CHLO|nr:hypothetical protein HYH03_012131 [Edaphochlamys debaryana]|eukprot:KAG2489299.1 hypothetical protein HYH03_012131 [Edaphochlamys debaryana]
MTTWRQSSNAQASCSGCVAAPARLSGRGSLPLAWAHQPKGAKVIASATALLDDASFRVAPRRQQQLPRAVQHFLNLPSGIPHPEEAVRAVQVHLLARIGFLMRAHQALRQHLAQWRPFRRTPLHVDAAGVVHATAAAAAHHTAKHHANRWADQGLAAERALDFDEAIRCFERAVESEPDSAEYWARLSKLHSDRSFMPNTSVSRQVELQKKAIEIGQKATEADPASAWGLVATCVSRGRLALHSDNRTKVSLARQAQDDVHRALQLEPDNDVAHHLLGRWNYEMASVNAVVRTIIQMIYGTALMAGSYKEAALCFENATRLRPDMVIHRVELGRTYVRLGRLEEAARHLEESLLLDEPDINAVLVRQDAVALLAKIRGNAKPKAEALAVEERGAKDGDDKEA